MQFAAQTFCLHFRFLGAHLSEPTLKLERTHIEDMKCLYLESHAQDRYRNAPLQE